MNKSCTLITTMAVMLISLNIRAQINASTFQASVQFPTNTKPMDVAIGDLDMDGKPDMVSCNIVTNDVSVLRNQSSTGVINPASFASAVSFPSGGTETYGVAIGDIDGDGKPEIVSVNRITGNMSVFLNATSVGVINSSSFATRLDFVAGSLTRDVTIADFDGDGKNDVAAINQTTFSIWRNTSSIGSISFATRYDKVHSVGYGFGIAYGDLNGDGKLDLALAGETSGSGYYSTSMNQSVPGGLAFQNVTIWSLGSNYFSHDVAIADMNGDNKPDILVTAENSNLSVCSLYVATNLSTLAVITMSGPAVMNGGSQYGGQGVGAADIDGDGNKDILLVYTGNYLRVYRNIYPTVGITLTPAHFENYVSYLGGSGGGFENYSRLASADLDNDGKPDVVLTDNNSNDISVFKNITSTVQNITTSTSVATATCPGAPVSVPFTATAPFQGTNIFTAQLSDATGSFASPTAIGTLAGTISGTINATIPGVTPLGNNYRIRVVSSNPVLTGSDNGTDIIVSGGYIVGNSITINPSSTVCSGTSVTFTATPVNGGTTPVYQWKRNATIVGTNSPTYTTTVYANGDVFTCVLTSSLGVCAANNPATSNGITMNVSSVPAQPSVITGPTSVCQSSTNTYSVTLVAGVTYNWTLPGGWSGSSTTNSINATAGLLSGTISVSATNSCGTSSVRTLAVATSIPPTTSNAGPDQNICATTTTLAGNTPGIGTGTWTLVSGAATITTPTSSTSGVTALGVGANTLRWTISNGSCAPSFDDVVITRDANPTVANAGADQNICATTATLAGNTPAVGTGTWTLISGAGTITIPTSPTSGLTGLGVGTNTFRWTISNGSCTASTDDVNINVSAAPTISNAGADQNICATTATLAGNTPVVGTGTWTLVSGSGVITLPSSPTSGLTGLGVGANTFRWTISNGSCAASFDDVVITRDANPTVANAGADQNICATTATLAGNAPAVGTGTWTLVSGSGVITLPSSPTSGITGLGVGANTFRWTISNGSCTASFDDVIITRDANPTVANAGADQNICSTTATLAGNTPAVGTGTWTLVSGAATITTPTSPTSGLTAIGVGANTFRWTISNGSCTASFDDVIITRDANPTISNAGADQNICATTATLAGNTPAVGTGTWSLVSGSGVITLPSSPASGLTGLGVGANTLRWTISNGSCTASFDDVIITRDANPTVANAGADQNICATTATLAGNTPAVGTGTWTLISGAATITTPTSPISGITAIGVGANTLRWTISNGSCTASFDDVIITRDANPTVANAGVDQNICSTTATLAGNTPAVGTGTWTLVSGAATITIPTSPTSGLTGLGVGINTFRWTISNGSCTVSTDDVNINVSAAPTVSNAGVDQNICSTTVTLAGNTPAVGTGTWSLISGIGVITSPSSPTSAVTGMGIGANTFRWTISNGTCAASFDDVIITVNTSPAQPGAITGPVQICNGTTNTYSISAVGGATSYTWTLPGGWIGTSTTNSISATANTVSGTITVTADNTCGSSTAQTLAVTVSNPALTVFPTSETCFGSCDGNINAITTGGIAPYNYSPSLTNLCAGNYTVNVTDNIGCTTTQSTSIGQPAQLVLSSSATPSSYCSGNCSQLLCNATGGTPGYTYLWSDGNTTTTTNVCPTVTTTYTCTVTDANGCSQSTTVTVTVNPLPTVTYVETQSLVCINWNPITLSAGSPLGGTYSGPGVTGNQFDPVVAGAGTWNIVYTYADGNSCSDSVTQQITVDLCLGINGNQVNDGISVYPNPFNSVVTVITDETKNSQIEVYNVLGEIVYQAQIQNQKTEIDLSRVPDGVYFIRINDGKKIVTEKIIKQ